MVKATPEWKRYERLVAKLVSDQLSTAYSVTPNARVMGRFSEVYRQIDILIDARHDTDNQNRIIVDAKKHTRQIDVKEVEAFLGFMADVEATHGYLVCPSGFTPAAQKRAQGAISLRLLLLDRLENFDPSTWPSCLENSCKNGRVFWDGYPCLDLVLVPLEGHSKQPQLRSYVHYVGKCDACRRFHVKCETCGDIFSPPHDSDEDYGMQCKCRPPWFWIASIEEDEFGRKSAELHVVRAAGNMQTVDRRSL